MFVLLNILYVWVFVIFIVITVLHGVFRSEDGEGGVWIGKYS